MDNVQAIDIANDNDAARESCEPLGALLISGSQDSLDGSSLAGFLDYHVGATYRLTNDPERGSPGRPPTAYEQAVAVTVWETYIESIKVKPHPDLDVVSATTGSGKTNGGLILMAYLYLADGASSAFLTEHNSEVERDYQKLLKLLPKEVVGVWSHFHDVKASEADVAQEEVEKDIKFTRPMAKEVLKQHPVIVTTHHQWVAEAKGQSIGIRRYGRKDRTIIIIDEEIRIDDTFTCQPQDISALADLYADTKVGEEARDCGFITKHYAAETLRDIANSMGSLKDEQRNLAALSSSSAMITEAHREVIRSLELADLKARINYLIRVGKLDIFNERYRTRALDAFAFIHACSDGMAFYAKDSAKGGTFFGYKPPLPPERRTLILDGTADINSVYRLTKGMRISRGPPPNYEQLEVNFHELPKLFKGRMSDQGLYANALTAAEVMNYFLEWVKLYTDAGDEILVYGKKRLLSFKSWMQWPGAEVLKANAVRIEGRKLHFVNFGRGRGSNDWRDCNVYVQIHDYYQAKGPTAARVGSLTSRAIGERELASMSGSRTSHEQFNALQDSHIRVHAKQNSSRTRMRNLDRDGKAPKTKLHFMGSAFKALADGFAVLYPKAPMPKWHAAIGEALRNVKATPKAQKAPKAAGGSSHGVKTETLRKLLMESTETILDGKVIEGLTGILSDRINAALASHSISPIVKTRAWTKTTRKAVGWPGKGYVMHRSA